MRGTLANCKGLACARGVCRGHISCCFSQRNFVVAIKIPDGSEGPSRLHVIVAFWRNATRDIIENIEYA